MLELRPTCEHCRTSLPPNSTDAMICTFECTFCRTCVEDVLMNVCSNCGGGFTPRPIRPAKNIRNDNYLGACPATETVTHKPVSIDAHREFAESYKNIPPEKR